MKKICILLLLLITMGCSKRDKTVSIKESAVVETFFGKQVTDHYRNLEKINDSTVIKYLKDYNAYTENKLSGLKKHKKRLVKLQNDFERVKTSSYRTITYLDDYIIYLKRGATDNIYRLYYKDVNDKEVLVFDPRAFKYKGENDFKINYFKASWDFSNVVISLSKKGKEFSKLLILDVKKQKTHSEVISHSAPTIIGGIYWLQDNSGFIYTRFRDTLSSKKSHLNTQSVLHILGKEEEKYIDLFSKSKYSKIQIDKADYPVVKTFKNAKYAIGTLRREGSYYDAYYTHEKILAGGGNNDWKPLFKKKDKVKSYFQQGDNLIFKTSKNASNFKICKTSILKPDFENSTVLVKEKKNEVLKEYAWVGGSLFFGTIRDGIEAKMFVLDKDGSEKEIKLPISAGKMSFKSVKEKNILSVILEGWTTPKTRYIYNTITKEFTLDKGYPSFIDYDFSDLVVEEVSVASHDGEDIPLSLIYNRKMVKNGNTPMLMRAYGAYGITMSANFYYGFLLWAKEGGIYAVAHVRGGGEKGESWRKAGYKKTKPNSWKDFISCSEYVIENNFTSSDKLAIWSGSAGGVTLGRAITERPDLYAASIIDRGFMNSIRIEAGAGNGSNNIKEFGTIKDSLEFKYLLEMDSYHHIKPNTKYPSVLITTGMNDSRLPPWHSIKFATKLQAANTSSNPILLKSEFDSGHGMVFTKKDEEFNMVAEVYSFALWQTGHPDYQLKE